MSAEEAAREEAEEQVNDLIAIIWPRLDAGESKDDVMCDVDNVLDSWEPTERTTP